MDSREPVNTAPGSSTPPVDTVPPTPPSPLRRLLFPALVLVLLGLLLRALFKMDGLEALWNVTLVLLGLGFIIFIHELGHFLVAKWCDVHVETFSIGFGPALPGCSFRRGETLYKIALIPLGGYVKMLGEGAEDDEGADDPRSFKNKPVLQRMAIISAGVIMNTILACLCFIIVYRFHGKLELPTVVESVVAGSPAWQKGFRTGMIVERIEDIDRPYFDQFKTTVALSAPGEELTLRVRFRDGPTQEQMLSITPRKSKEDPTPVLGFHPGHELTLYPPEVSKRLKAPYVTGSAAARATPPFEFGDQIVGTTDPDLLAAAEVAHLLAQGLGALAASPAGAALAPPAQYNSALAVVGSGAFALPATATPLPVNPYHPWRKLDAFEFHKRMVRLAGQPVVLQVRRRDGARADIAVPPAFHQTLGLRMRMGEVTAVRAGSPADGKVVAADPAHHTRGDILKYAEVQETDGNTVRFVTSPPSNAEGGAREVIVDPARLPFELQRWAERTLGPKQVTLLVLREKDKTEKAERLVLDWDDSWRYSVEVPGNQASPQSVPGWAWLTRSRPG